MALKVRITNADGQVEELVLAPGSTLTVAEGDTVEVIDSSGRSFEIAAEGDDVVVTLLGKAGRVVLIDGIPLGGAPDETYTFENLALYIEDDDIDSAIVYTDPGTDEIVGVSSIEELLGGISTAAGGGVPQGTFGASPEPPAGVFAQGDPLGVPPQDPPAAPAFGFDNPQSPRQGGDDDDIPPVDGASGNSAGVFGTSGAGGGDTSGNKGGGTSGTSGGGTSGDSGGGTSDVGASDAGAGNATLITNFAQGKDIVFSGEALLHTGPDGGVSIVANSFVGGILVDSLTYDTGSDTVTLVLESPFNNTNQVPTFTYQYVDGNNDTQTATVEVYRDVAGDLDGTVTGGNAPGPGNDANDILVHDSGTITIEGGAGNDALFGGPVMDTLIGGAGSDLLFGGGGNDIFVINGEDVGTGTDTIVDFDPTIGGNQNNPKPTDELDLSDIFADAEVGSPIEGVHFSFVDGDFDNDGDADDTAVFVDTNGSGSFGGDPVVVLLNVAATDLDVGTNVDVV